MQHGLSYPQDHQVAISLALTGCRGATNGALNRSAAGFGTPRSFGPALLTQLEALTGYRS
jgi:hypothetical protein